MTQRFLILFTFGLLTKSILSMDLESRIVFEQMARQLSGQNPTIVTPPYSQLSFAFWPNSGVVQEPNSPKSPKTTFSRIKMCCKRLCCMGKK